MAGWAQHVRAGADTAPMSIDVEHFGGLVVRWPEYEAWLLFAPGALAHWVVRGRVLGRAIAGVA